MKIVFSKRILKKELGARPSKEDIKIIKKGYFKGIYDVIKGSNMPPNTKLIKIYATTSHDARRMVFMVDMRSKDGFFLFYRPKDDPIGKNISIQNADFRSTLNKYLSLLSEDISIDNIEVIDEQGDL